MFFIKNDILFYVRSRRDCQKYYMCIILYNTKTDEKCLRISLENLAGVVGYITPMRILICDFRRKTTVWSDHRKQLYSILTNFLFLWSEKKIYTLLVVCAIKDCDVCIKKCTELSSDSYIFINRSFPCSTNFIWNIFSINFKFLEIARKTWMLWSKRGWKMAQTSEGHNSLNLYHKEKWKISFDRNWLNFIKNNSKF